MECVFRIGHPPSPTPDEWHHMAPSSSPPSPPRSVELRLTIEKGVPCVYNKIGKQQKIFIRRVCCVIEHFATFPMIKCPLSIRLPVLLVYSVSLSILFFFSLTAEKWNLRTKHFCKFLDTLLFIYIYVFLFLFS